MRTQRARASVMAGLLVAGALPPHAAARLQDPPLPAFPGAEGFGKFAQGGRGGIVLTVSNLNDSGPGSLREALTMPLSVPRTIVFGVGGGIVLSTPIETSQSFITVAGETAPGDGVYVRGAYITFMDAEHIIVRNIAIRTGCTAGIVTDYDALGFSRCRHVIIDSVTASFGVDENISFRDCDLVTIQWSITSYGLQGLTPDRCHSGDGDHSCGMLISNYNPGSNRISIIHNLFSQNSKRTPLITNQGPGQMYIELIGNFIYNWGTGPEYGNEFQLACGANATNAAMIFANIVGNMYRYGPDTEELNPAIGISNYRVRPGACAAGASPWTNMKLYRQGNRFQIETGLGSDESGQWVRTDPPGGYTFLSAPAFTPTYVPSLGVGDVVAEIAERAGAGGSLVHRGRDYLDRRAIWTAILHRPGLINNQDQVLEDNDGNGTPDWPVYRNAPPPCDTDTDGMPDYWEASRGYDRTVPDGNIPVSPNGYTRLETYLHSLSTNRTRLINLAPPCPTGMPGCYPNCDGSTGTPALTPADFVCFLNRFRAGC